MSKILADDQGPNTINTLCGAWVCGVSWVVRCGTLRRASKLRRNVLSHSAEGRRASGHSAMSGGGVKKVVCRLCVVCENNERVSAWSTRAARALLHHVRRLVPVILPRVDV